MRPIDDPSLVTYLTYAAIITRIFEWFLLRDIHTEYLFNPYLATS